MLLLLHRGRSVFSHLFPCTFQALSFLPSAVISSSLAAKGGGRQNMHHRRCLIFLVLDDGRTQPWQHPPPPSLLATSGRKPHHVCVHQHPCVSSEAWGMLWGGLWGLCRESGTYIPLFSKPGAALDMAEPAEERELLRLAGV